MFKFAVFNLFFAGTGYKASGFIRYAAEIETVSISYHSLITVIAVLICLALLTLVYINRNHQKRSKADEIFNEITLSRNPDKTWMLLKKHASETLSGMIDFINVSYSETIEGMLNRDIRTLQKINSTLDRQTGKQKKIQQRESQVLQRIDRNITLEKSTWLHLTNSCAEQMIYCVKRITVPCIEHTGDTPGYMERSAAEITATIDLLKSFMSRIKKAIETSDYSEYEQLFFMGTHISEEFSRLRLRLIDCLRKDVEKDLNSFNFYLHILQESEELVCILRLLFRASRKLQSDQRF
ncbi:MAG: hypothetical protein LBL07_05830 [Tannerella sp.]|jgi:Tfp pilus assembly protein FimT|nr:hypothetical protein [Tannerella sp.]